MTSLLSPITLNDLTLKNRVFMAPLTRSRANNKDHAPVDMHVEYYRQRASAGLIISEGTVVSHDGVGYIHVPGIYSEKQVEAWNRITDAVHEDGGRIFMQAWHVGRISHPLFQRGKAPLAPSAINPGVESFTIKGRENTITPHEMSADDILRTIDDFASASANAMKAGFDGVEIHSSNGYLFHQFFSKCSNVRSDGYGGSIENRARFLFDVIEAMSATMPVERIGVRLNPMMHEASGMVVDDETIPTFDHIVERLNDYKLAFLHLTRPWRVLDEPWFLSDTIGHYRRLYNGTLVANFGYQGAEANREIQTGRADAVAFGRLFISNPDLPERLHRGWPIIEPDRATFYGGDEHGYTDYPKHQ